MKYQTLVIVASLAIVAFAEASAAATSNINPQINRGNTEEKNSYKQQIQDATTPNACIYMRHNGRRYCY